MRQTAVDLLSYNNRYTKWTLFILYISVVTTNTEADIVYFSSKTLEAYVHKSVPISAALDWKSFKINLVFKKLN